MTELVREDRERKGRTFHEGSPIEIFVLSPNEWTSRAPERYTDRAEEIFANSLKCVSHYQANFSMHHELIFKTKSIFLNNYPDYTVT